MPHRHEKFPLQFGAGKTGSAAPLARVMSVQPDHGQVQPGKILAAQVLTHFLQHLDQVPQGIAVLLVKMPSVHIHGQGDQVPVVGFCFFWHIVMPIAFIVLPGLVVMLSCRFAQHLPHCEAKGFFGKLAVQKGIGRIPVRPAADYADPQGVHHMQRSKIIPHMLVNEAVVIFAVIHQNAQHGRGKQAELLHCPVAGANKGLQLLRNGCGAGQGALFLVLGKRLLTKPAADGGGRRVFQNGADRLFRLMEGNAEQVVFLHVPAQRSQQKINDEKLHGRCQAKIGLSLCTAVQFLLHLSQTVPHAVRKVIIPQ